MKNIKIYLMISILPFFLQLIVRFIYFTAKKTYHFPKKVDSKETLLVCMWHGDLLMQPLNYRAFRKNGTLKAIISEHKDGAIISKVCKYLGVYDIKGSSSKGGIKALRTALKEIKKGTDVAITPDGPRGPKFTIADGLVAIAHKTETRIIALNCVPKNFWMLNSWDNFIIPKPFTAIDFYISEPFSVENMSVLESKDIIKNKLLANAIK